MVSCRVVVWQAHWVCDECGGAQGYEGPDADGQARVGAIAHEASVHGRATVFVSKPGRGEIDSARP